MSQRDRLQQLKAVLTPILVQYNVSKAVLFGSYGKGNATEKSDIDLMVDSGLHGLRFVGLLDELCQATGKAVDLFDVTHIQTGSEIEREIQRTGVVVYEK